MTAKAIFIGLLLFGFALQAQEVVSGYVNMENPQEWEQQIYLSQIHSKTTSGVDSSAVIATTQIREDGFFAFDASFFEPQDHLYKVSINTISAKEKKQLQHTVNNYKSFILSNKDKLYFRKGKQLFSDYTNSNQADKEWRKLKSFEAKYKPLAANFDPKKYLSETKGYVKDSLHILLVKLISIKNLEDKNLLEKDIKANPEYYLDLLRELQSSELEPSAYTYFENKLALLSQHEIQQKYTMSIFLNIIAFLIIIFLAFLVLKSRKNAKKAVPLALSKQENTVKSLIAAGKSNKEIANELFISLSTVKTHITNIYSKLNISSRKELLNSDRY